jgi:hypothetical protein
MFCLVELLNSDSGDGPRDDQLLDLLGAFEDVEVIKRCCPYAPAAHLYDL